MLKFSKRKTVTSRVTSKVLAMTLIGIAILSIFVWHFYRSSNIFAHARRAGFTAAGFANAIDPSRFEASAAADFPDEYTILLQERLLSLTNNLDDDTARVFIVVPHSANQLRYIVPPPGVAFGTVVSADAWGPHGQYALHALRLGEMFYDTSPYTIQGAGNTIPAFAPILGSQNQVLGLVVVNFEISAALREANIFALLMAAAGTFAAFLIWFTMRRMISSALSYSLKRIVSADHTFADNSTVFKARDDDAGSIDEIALLYSNFGEIYQSFNMLIKDITNLVEEHLSGHYSIRLDETKYVGGHRDLVKGINAMVNLYVDDVVEILKVVQEYGKGNFEPTVNTYPGDWVWANEAMDHLQKTFINLAAEMGKLVENFNKGNFDVVANAEGTQGEWYKLIEELNEIAFTVRMPIAEIKEVMNWLGNEGRLDKRIEGDYYGEFAEIKNEINLTMDNLKEVIQDVSQTLSAVAAGDLTVRISGHYPGDFSEIKESLNNIGSTLSDTMKKIDMATGQLLSGANQISKSAIQLANGATEQSSSVEELNSSTEIISDQVQKNAKSAELANKLSDKSAQNAQEGNVAMSQLLDAMVQIKESSGNISHIIKVIQDIAFQTNLLALNAAIEAARAGDHGKGFAVVAEEVQNLAARSQTATTETTDLIENSISKVEIGRDIAQTTAEALDTIVTSAGEVLEIINNISSSSRDQAEAIGQLSIGLSSISQVVQSNSAISEETAAAAEELNSQAEILRQLVDYFKL